MPEPPGQQTFLDAWRCSSKDGSHSVTAETATQKKKAHPHLSPIVRKIVRMRLQLPFPVRCVNPSESSQLSTQSSTPRMPDNLASSAQYMRRYAVSSS